jgi:hypothetical protein
MNKEWNKMIQVAQMEEEHKELNMENWVIGIHHLSDEEVKENDD